MIILPQEIKIANSQTIKFEEYSLRKDPEGKLSSEIRFSVFNENGAFIKSIILTLRDQEHNNFWDAFNSGSDIYKILAEKNSLNFAPSQEAEDEFINKNT